LADPIPVCAILHTQNENSEHNTFKMMYFRIAKPLDPLAETISRYLYCLGFLKAFYINYHLKTGAKFSNLLRPKIALLSR
jgi:hypothetical protein